MARTRPGLNDGGLEDDGLLQPAEPFRTPRWFTVVITLAVVTAVVLALTAIL